MSMPLGLLIMAMFFSIFLTLLSLYRHPVILKNQAKISIEMMKEDLTKKLLVTDIVNRYRISLDEAGMESLFQFVFQWGTYFALLYPLQLVKLASLDSAPVLRNIDENLNFSILWVSGTGSFLSLVMSLLKRHDTQHKSCTSVKQRRVLYLAASIANTASYSILFITLVTTSMDFCMRTRTIAGIFNVSL